MDLPSPKKVLENLGYIVSRVPPATQTMTADQRITKGWLVEFVGPSGIGKTTLHQQIARAIKKDWFFEAHAKGLVGQVRANDATEAYIKQLFVRRLENLQNININLETIAKISQRVCEVTRLGLVSKSIDVPRGFIMDDGLAHFFAEQILEQDTNSTEAFLSKTAFVFLLPDEADTRPPTLPHTRTQLDVYHDLRDLMLSLGRPTLVLKRSEHNAEKVLSFIRHDVLNLEQGTPANPAI